MLRHPFYAGAYAFGRCPFDPMRRTPGKRNSGRWNAPPEQWVCLLKDKVPAYISWEQYEQNRRRLAANDRGPGSKKATGHAPTLLNGIVRCGRCGRMMAAEFANAFDVFAHSKSTVAAEENRRGILLRTVGLRSRHDNAFTEWREMMPRSNIRRFICGITRRWPTWRRGCGYISRSTTTSGRISRWTT